jgi:sn-glycerol 3-phosphate transport system ATP-binding protein/multiple sugar transport system ATP-binding protein
MTLADVIFVLNKGLVEQSGPPLEIFDKPTTKFVAGFLGSPAMNFIDGQIVRKGQTITFQARGDLVVPIDVTTFGPDLDPGRNVTLGVRPHEVSLAESVNSVGKLAVSVVEALGAETYAHGELGTSSFVARLEATTSIKKGASFPIAFRAIHLFDATSGQSLRRTASTRSSYSPGMACRRSRRPPRRSAAAEAAATRPPPGPSPWMGSCGMPIPATRSPMPSSWC